MSNSSIKIPEDRNPFTVTVNGVTETFAPGTTAEVSPAVAAVIEGREKYPPEPAEPETPFPAGGGGGGVLIVHATDNEAGTAAVLDKTWQEIKDASATSVVVLSMGFGSEFSYLFSCVHTTIGGGRWKVGFTTNGEDNIFVTTEGANAYPDMQYE